MRMEENEQTEDRPGGASPPENQEPPAGEPGGAGGTGSDREAADGPNRTARAGRGHQAATGPHRLTRSREDRFVGGVAAGLARYFGIDPTLVRVAFAVSLVFGGVGVFAYLVLLAMIPIEGDPDEPAPPVTGNRRAIAIGGTLLVGALACLASIAGGSGSEWLFGFGPGVVFGIFLWIGVAAGLVWALRRSGAMVPKPDRKAAAAPVAGAGLTGPGRPGPGGPVPSATGPEASSAATQFAASPTQLDPDQLATEATTTGVAPADEPATRTMAGEQPTAQMTSGGRPTARTGSGAAGGPGGGSSAPVTFGRVMTWLAIALAGVIVLGILAVISFGVTALFGAIPAAAVVVLCGFGVVGLALADRPQFALWTTAAAVAVAVPMAVVSIASLDIEGDWGEINERPVAAIEIPADGFKMAGGALKVDLREFPFRKGRTVELNTTSGFGATSVIVPDDVCVVGDIEGKVGYIDMRGTESQGIDPGRSISAPDAGVPVLKLDSEFRLGYFGVFDATGWTGRADSWPDDLENQNRSAARDRARAACLGAARIPGGGPDATIDSPATKPGRPAPGQAGAGSAGGTPAA
jgi:phage shock protein PspC (stress-responsive transcriptional regulator)